ncbi:MAG TPA: carboxypeptidase-like regulatory domain-containing protein, partial [Bryobacteraceae bacterium]|nr:carboxypeptidase-like regulatory domain-containing protein [Bryobacteraceae bacterium]
GWSGEPITGLVAVAVDHGAAADHLDVDLGWTSCGLWYADRSQCPQSDLQVEQLSGQVLDASGAAIPDAKILLFDPGETLVERLQSDNAGKFTSPHSLVGTYQLVVSSAGFTPLRRTLHAEPTGNPTRTSALTVQLGVFGSCSAADLQ